MKNNLLFILILFSACNSNQADKIRDHTTQNPASEDINFKEAITQFPDSFLLKENLIQYYRNNENFTTALSEVKNYLVKDSNNPRLWEIKAILHFEDADTLHAISDFEKAISIFPNPQYLISLGTLYAQTKDARAVKLADLMLAQNNQKFEKESMFIKGLFYSFNNEKIKAITFFDKCIALNFTFMDAYREKAIALYDLEKYAESLAVLDKAITLQNNFDEGYYYSGRCLEKLNRIPEAIQSYKNALIYDPEYIEAKGALTRLGVTNNK